MKEKWTDPNVVVQKFTPNEFISACIEGTIQCIYPGDPNQYDEYIEGSSTIYVDSEEHWHGVCGNPAHIVFSEDTGRGYEVVNGKIDYLRPIYDIEGEFPLAHGTYEVTWTSEDDHSEDHGKYHHRGRLIITNIIQDRPNHS